MKYLFILMSLFFCFSVYAQNKLSLPGVNAEFPNVLKPHHGINKSQACGTDTVYYTDAKASSQSTKIAFKTGSTSTGFVEAYSQYFGAATNITVNGFRWFGKSNDPNHTSNPVVNVVCEMYDVDANGLPTGAPLASETLAVDTSSINIQHDIVFTSPITTSNPYVIVVKNNQIDQLFVLSNDEQAHDGANEGLCGVYYEPLGQWRKAVNLFGNGDFDMLFYPFVDYTINASFTTPASGCQNVSSTFTNNSSNHYNSKFYNVDKFNGNPLQHNWNYGDGNTSTNQLNGSNAYATASTYTITLTSTINGWTMNCTDTYSTTFQVYPTPVAPTSTPPSPVCEYTAIGNLTASGGAGTYTWYDDSIFNLLGTGSPYNSTINLPDTVYVTNTENGCESAGTPVILNFLSNPIPAFTTSDIGGGTFNFTGAPSATTYAWDFGDGNIDSIQSPSNTYSGTGSFTACLNVTYSNGCQNQDCSTITITGVEENEMTPFTVYPNPADNIIYINFESIQTTQNKIYIFNTIGELMDSKTSFAQRIELDLSKYSSGIYLVKVVDGNNRFKTIKITKR